MRTYKVALPKLNHAVGVVIEHGKVSIVHPAVGVKIGASIEEVKKRVKKKKGSIVRVMPIKGQKKKKKRRK